jgi:DNA recombination protein RmuC
MSILLPLLTLVIGTLLGAVAVLVWSRRAGDPDVLRALSARGDDQAVLRDGLERLHERLMDVEQQRASWQGQLRQQVDDMRHSTDLLRRETGALSTALRKPHVRGQWGELHLRRAVELAGMVEHCDFDTQVTVHGDDGDGRPDMVVRLAGGRNIAVDAKAPMAAWLAACEGGDGAAPAGPYVGDQRSALLTRHARAVRAHVDALAGKAYWRALHPAPDFVVLFVPGEAFLDAALSVDPLLADYAFERQVVIATPSTLIALLRTVAFTWRQERLSASAEQVHALGRELYRRLSTFGEHLGKVGAGLDRAVNSYNAAVRSLDTRVLVSARRFADLGVTGDELPGPEPVHAAVASPSAGAP